MKVSRMSFYALKLNFSQTPLLTRQVGDRTLVRSAAILAACGLALSTFSLKQMFNKAPRRF